MPALIASHWKQLFVSLAVSPREAGQQFCEWDHQLVLWHEIGHHLTYQAAQETDKQYSESPSAASRNASTFGTVAGEMMADAHMLKILAAERDEVRSYFHAISLCEDYLHFWDPSTRDDALNSYHNYQVFTIRALLDQEPSGFLSSFIELMKSKIPLIDDPDGGLPESDSKEDWDKYFANVSPYRQWFCAEAVRAADEIAELLEFKF